MRTSILLLLCGLAFASGCQRSQSALVVRQRTTVSGLQKTSAESTQYWTASAMMVDEPAHRIIVDFNAETITSLDKATRTYVVASFDDVNARMASQRKLMEQDTAGLAPDVIDALEQVGEPVGNRAAQVDVTL